MKVEIIRDGNRWLVLDGTGKVVASVYNEWQNDELPRDVLRALEQTLLSKEERASGF